MISRLRNYFTTGLLLTGPLFVTVYLLWFLVSYIDNFVMDFIPSSLFGYSLDTQIPGVGILATLVMLIIVGFFTVHVIGVSLSIGLNYLFDRLPFVRALYRLTNQVFRVVLADQGSGIARVVLVENPRKGIWSIGFTSCRPPREVSKKIGQDCLLIFVPTSPNPTSGLTLVIPKKDVIFLNISKEEAISIIISIGTSRRISDDISQDLTPTGADDKEKELAVQHLSRIHKKLATGSESEATDEATEEPKKKEDKLRSEG